MGVENELWAWKTNYDLVENELWACGKRIVGVRMWQTNCEHVENVCVCVCVKKTNYVCVENELWVREKRSVGVESEYVGVWNTNVWVCQKRTCRRKHGRNEGTD